MSDEIDLSAFPEIVRHTYESFSGKLVGTPIFGTDQGNGFHGVPFSKDLDGVDIAVVGCAYDLGATFRSGARFGPRHLRQLSRFVGIWPVGAWPWDRDVRSDHTIIDMGDIAFAAGYWDSFRDSTIATIDQVMAAGANPFALGGDHFVTYPLAKAVAAKYGPLSIVHFDAHTDDFPSPNHNHGTMFFHGLVEGWIDAEHSVHIGIRSPYDHSPSLGYSVLDAIHVHDHSAADIADTVKRIVGDRPVYLTFDIDFVDPAFAPGTGTPVPGGPDSYKSREILFELDRVELDIVAGDLVEVAPLYDGPGEITVLLGATLGADILNLIGNARTRRS